MALQRQSPDDLLRIRAKGEKRGTRQSTYDLIKLFFAKWGVHNMRRVFDELAAKGAPAVRSLLGRAEDLDFDCKRKQDSANGYLERKDRDILGEIISAFSNSIGGLLIWGPDARKDPGDGIDKIIDFYPISDIFRFESEVKQAVVDLLMPRHPGIYVQAIPETSGAGFLLVYVERSERRPHRSEAAGDKRYYQRAGSTSRVMEHFEIEDAFRRQTTPILELITTLYQGAAQSGGVGPSTFDVGLNVSLRNISHLSAMYPYVLLEIRGNWNKDMGRQTPDVKQRPEAGFWCFEGNNDVVIHPGITRTMINIRRGFSGRFDGASQKLYLASDSIKGSDLNFKYGCLNVQAQSKVIRIEWDELRRHIAAVVEIQR